MTNFNPKFFKCIAEQEKQGVGGEDDGALFGKMKEAMIGTVDDEIFICDRHKINISKKVVYAFFNF